MSRNTHAPNLRFIEKNITIFGCKRQLSFGQMHPYQRIHLTLGTEKSRYNIKYTQSMYFSLVGGVFKHNICLLCSVLAYVFFDDVTWSFSIKYYMYALNLVKYSFRNTNLKEIFELDSRILDKFKTNSRELNLASVLKRMQYF